MLFNKNQESLGMVKVGKSISFTFQANEGVTIQGVVPKCKSCTKAKVKHDNVVEVTFTAEDIPIHLVNSGIDYHDIDKKIEVYYRTKDHPDTNQMTEFTFTAKVVR